MDDCVLITGAGGSIGHVLSERLIRDRAAKTIVLLDFCEYNLYRVEHSVRLIENGVEIVPLIVNIRDVDTMGEVLSTYRPARVYHAAALKHVPMLEAPHNLVEAVKTNVFAVSKLAGMISDMTGVRCAGLVSTDKAVNPTSLMGATKRCAERYWMNRGVDQNTPTNFTVVRFGNVVGSSGSVVPLFKKQIESGGPVTVTHPEMTRYMMSIEEAARLTVEAASISHGLYMLEMGEPVRILDLANSLMREANKEVAVEFIGVRDGEKLHESLNYDHEKVISTGLAGIFGLYSEENSIYHPDVDLLFRQLELVLKSRNIEAIKAVIRQIVPQYTSDILSYYGAPEGLE